MKEEDVVQYLSKSPDFFVKNPELLESLTLPHPVHGNVVSLLEYQVELLRKSTASYRREFERLVSVARQNEAIMQKTRRLILAGLECSTLDELAVVIDDMVRDEFEASHHTLLLFNENRGSSIRCCSDAERKEYLSGMPNLNISSCVLLGDTALRFLFPETYRLIRSTAILPILCLQEGKKVCIGVLVLGAQSSNTFTKEKETLFLQYIAELSSGIFQRLIE